MVWVWVLCSFEISWSNSWPLLAELISNAALHASFGTDDLTILMGISLGPLISKNQYGTVKMTKFDQGFSVGTTGILGVGDL